MRFSTQPLPEIIRQGRSLTANISRSPRAMRSTTPSSGLSGVNEFWDCIKTLPASRAQECVQYLLMPSGEKELKIDITKQLKLPVKFELKPNWIWFAAGFAAAWILKH